MDLGGPLGGSWGAFEWIVTLSLNFWLECALQPAMPQWQSQSTKPHGQPVAPTATAAGKGKGYKGTATGGKAGGEGTAAARGKGGEGRKGKTPIQNSTSRTNTNEGFLQLPPDNTRSASPTLMQFTPTPVMRQFTCMRGAPTTTDECGTTCPSASGEAVRASGDAAPPSASCEAVRASSVSEASRASASGEAGRAADLFKRPAAKDRKGRVRVQVQGFRTWVRKEDAGVCVDSLQQVYRRWQVHRRKWGDCRCIGLFYGRRRLRQRLQPTGQAASVAYDAS